MADNRVVAGFKRVLPESRFARNIAVLAGGAAGAQAITMVASPALTRLYTPEDFGVLGVYTAMVGILGVVASMRYHLAIPLPESDEEAANVATLSLLITLAMSVVTGALFWFFRQSIANTLSAPALEKYIWLVPVGLLALGIYQVFYYWGIRSKDFRRIAKTRLAQALSMLLVQLSGFLFGAVALLLGRVAGYGAGTGTLARPALIGDRNIFRLVSYQGIKQAAYRYRDFPLYSSWAGLVNAGGTQLPQLILAALYGAGPAGFYLLANRVLAAPLNIVGQSVADALTSKSVEAARESQLGEVTVKVYASLARLALPTAIVLFVTSPRLCAFIFGSEWQDSGYIIRWLLPMLFLRFLTSPLSRVLITLELQRLSLLLQGGILVLRLLAFSVAYALSASLIDTIILFSGFSVVGFVIFIWYIFAKTNAPHIALIAKLAEPLVVGIIAVLPVIVLQQYWVSSGATMLLSLLPACILILMYWMWRYRFVSE